MERAVARSTISFVRDLVRLTQVFDRKCDVGHCSIQVKSDNVREAAFYATKEEKAGHQGEDRHDNRDAKNMRIDRAASEHCPAKTFDETDRGIQCKQRLPSRRNYADGINN